MLWRLARANPLPAAMFAIICRLGWSVSCQNPRFGELGSGPLGTGSQALPKWGLRGQSR